MWSWSNGLMDGWLADWVSLFNLMYSPTSVVLHLRLASLDCTPILRTLMQGVRRSGGCLYRSKELFSVQSTVYTKTHRGRLQSCLQGRVTLLDASALIMVPSIMFSRRSYSLCHSSSSNTVYHTRPSLSKSALASSICRFISRYTRAISLMIFSLLPVAPPVPPSISSTPYASSSVLSERIASFNRPLASRKWFA